MVGWQQELGQQRGGNSSPASQLMGAKGKGSGGQVTPSDAHLPATPYPLPPTPYPLPPTTGHDVFPAFQALTYKRGSLSERWDILRVPEV